MESIKLCGMKLLKSDSNFSYCKRFDFELICTVVQNSQRKFVGLDGCEYLLIDHWICIEEENEIVIIGDLGHYWHNNPFSKELIIPDEVSRIDESLLKDWHRWDKETIDHFRSFGMTSRIDEYIRFEKIYIGSRLEYTSSLDDYISACRDISISEANSNYKIIDDYIISVCNLDLIKYIGQEINSIVPHGIRRILSGVFKKNNITSLVIPNTVVEISSEAIDNCNKLETIICNGSIVIDSYGICECEKLETLIFNQSVEIKSNGVFCCKNLINIICNEDSPRIAANGITLCDLLEQKYSNCEEIILNKSLIKSRNNGNIVRVPKGITYISSGAFSSCKELKVLFIPNTVVDIGDGICNYCNGIKKVILEEGISLECAKAIVKKWYKVEGEYLHNNPFQQTPGVYSVYVPDELYEKILDGNDSTVEQVWEYGSHYYRDHDYKKIIVHVVKKTELTDI